MMKRTDIIIGILFIALGLIVLAIIPHQVRSSAELVDSTFVPKLSAYGMMLLGAVLAISTWLSARRAPVSSPKPRPDKAADSATGAEVRYLPVLLVTGASALYFFLMRPLGYLPATIVSLALFLRIFGEKRWWLLVLLSTLGAGVLYVVFAGIFYVRLP